MKAKAEFKKLLGTITTSAKKARETSQQALLVAANHAVSTGDIQYMNELNTVVGESFGLHLQARFQHFVCTHRAFRMHKGSFKVQVQKEQAGIQEDLNTIQDWDLWWVSAATEAKVQEDKPFDPKLWERFKKNILKASHNGADLNPLELEALRAIQAAIESRI